VVGLFIGHRHQKGRLFKLGLTGDPIGERCLEEEASAIHILCDCEAIACLMFWQLGQFFIEPSDYYDAPINNVLHFIRGVGLIKGRSLKVAVQGLNLMAHPSYIQKSMQQHVLKSIHFTFLLFWFLIFLEKWTEKRSPKLKSWCYIYNNLHDINCVIVQGILPSCFGARYIVSALFIYRGRERKELWNIVLYNNS
jgi:hypothetical protein